RRGGRRRGTDRRRLRPGRQTADRPAPPTRVDRPLTGHAASSRRGGRGGVPRRGGRQLGAGRGGRSVTIGRGGEWGRAGAPPAHRDVATAGGDVVLLLHGA